jgi:hypothetical protein
MSSLIICLLLFLIFPLELSFEREEKVCKVIGNATQLFMVTLANCSS